jgi:hypothetical protein
MPNKYFTVWAVNLATNTGDPSPTIVWFTDSPSLVSITPNGTLGALLTATGHSRPGGGYDINVWVTVDGVRSADFPVFINTPWTLSAAPPVPSRCIFANTPNGWQASVQYTATDLTGGGLVPIDTRETAENYKSLFAGENWGSPAEASWQPGGWNGFAQFTDTLAACWGGNPPPNPPTVQWNPGGNTQIDSYTQKFWLGGSYQRFVGECPIRQAVTFFTDHFTYTFVTTPITIPFDCAQGQYAN